MGTRETLRRRRDVPDADIEQIIEVAAALQDGDREAAAAPTVAEMERVAEELDIDPRYVERAIGQIARDREAQVAARASAAVANRRRLQLAGGIAAGILLGLLIAVGTGAATLRGLAADRVAAEQALIVVLDRQAGLAPQLAALAGADADLSDEVAAVRAAPDLEARIHAVEALHIEMAAGLSRLPPSASEAVRQDLHHEITGGWNRITVERRRLAEVEARAQAAASRPDVALATLLRFSAGRTR